MNNYKEFKDRQQKEFNEFPMFFAFDDKQFEEGLNKLNCTKDDLLSIGGGGFITKANRESFGDLHIKHYEEFKKAKEDEQFLYEMFLYELANHEYCITRDPTDTLECVGIAEEELENNTKIKTAFKKARDEYLNNINKEE